MGAEGLISFSYEVVFGSFGGKMMDIKAASSGSAEPSGGSVL